MYPAEARIEDAGNILIAPAACLIRDFFGSTIAPEDPASGPSRLAQRTIYLCGDVSAISDRQLRDAARVFVIRELSHGYRDDVGEPWTPIDLGRVPLRVHGLGVYYRRFFDLGDDHFGRIGAEHEFQSLTESTKPGAAHRSGIYLTPVTRTGDELHFRLLRCSTNLSGPTENFRTTDTGIVEALNREAATIFRDQAPLNHVLAQIYHNTLATAERKQSKAKISSHADKTKDMPVNGIMAFCTFYDGLDKLQPLTEDPFDYGIKGVSGLTRLRFRRKDSVEAREKTTLPAQFSLTLYPGSVFFMPLSTNRLYTHEIRPAMLDAELLPTRLGYVVRCSNTEAVHKNGRTYLERAGDFVELAPPTPDGMDELRRLYAEENSTSSFIDYGDRFLFSMNTGDYVAPPAPRISDEILSYALPSEEDFFAELSTSALLEGVGKGRRAATLTRTDEAGHVPLVRTTTRYSNPAQHFRAVHDRLAQQIQARAGLSVAFNNALVEIYTNAYTTMGSHSDQALDLADESFIAVFSCYRHPEADPPRKLIFEPKGSGEKFEIPLAHNGVVAFSVASNRQLKHKIVLDTPAKATENQWLGVTFRTAKTFLRFHDGHAYLPHGARLISADDDQQREFYQLRRRENNETNFVYPPLPYTISESDLIPPV